MKIAVERNFTRGRRKEQVEDACVYIICRYILGAVFLQLCKFLSLENHPFVQKPVDPSLFIHRFTDRLYGGRKPNISRTALHVVPSMKRDWMQGESQVGYVELHCTLLLFRMDRVVLNQKLSKSYTFVKQH